MGYQEEVFVRRLPVVVQRLSHLERYAEREGENKIPSIYSAGCMLNPIHLGFKANELFKTQKVEEFITEGFQELYKEHHRDGNNGVIIISAIGSVLSDVIESQALNKAAEEKAVIRKAIVVMRADEHDKPWACYSNVESIVNRLEKVGLVKKEDGNLIPGEGLPALIKQLSLELLRELKGADKAGYEK